MKAALYGGHGGFGLFFLNAPGLLPRVGFYLLVYDLLGDVKVVVFEGITCLGVFAQEYFIVGVGSELLSGNLGLDGDVKAHFGFVGVQKVVSLIFFMDKLARFFDCIDDMGNFFLQGIKLGHFDVFEFGIGNFLCLFGIEFD